MRTGEARCCRPGVSLEDVGKPLPRLLWTLPPHSNAPSGEITPLFCNHAPGGIEPLGFGSRSRLHRGRPATGLRAPPITLPHGAKLLDPHRGAGPPVRNFPALLRGLSLLPPCYAGITTSSFRICFRCKNWQQARNSERAGREFMRVVSIAAPAFRLFRLTRHEG